MGIKVVKNSCYGGFSFSRKAIERMAELGLPEAIEELKSTSIPSGNIYSFKSDSVTEDKFRTDPIVVQVVLELEGTASGSYAKLRVIELPDDVTEFHIRDYDGFETVYCGPEPESCCNIIGKYKSQENDY